MREIKAHTLTADNFKDFGTFYDFVNPTGHTLGTFFHDHILMSISGGRQLGFSSMVIEKKERMIITRAEFHNNASEAVLPLDSDIVIYVAPPSNEPCPALTQAFIVPKGTMVLMNAGVWHCTPFSAGLQTAHALVALPERVYHNDCTIIDYSENDYMEITV